MYKVRSKRKEETIKRILNTTIKMINEKGYGKTTTNHIAEEAGVSIGLIYKYFPKGKPEIIKEIVQSEYAEFLDENIYSKLTKEEFPSFLKKFLTLYIKQHKDNVSLIAGMEIALLSNKELFKDLEYFIHSELRFVPLISKILLQLGYSEKKNLEKTSKFLLFTIDSIIHRHAYYSDVLGSDEELIDYLIELILKFVG